MKRNFDINVDHPALMVWWSKKTHYYKNWRKYNGEWDAFFEANKDKEHFYRNEYYIKSYDGCPILRETTIQIEVAT